ncbi:uncharacterized protein LOC129286840 [Prosopis cineraria]|uniref:uncharacterized protein LOC129286840 n=1 Tax=Prosopis cineraria TaxID=364024 RepID=UPI0024101E55|nr:uncharacterized protein LOC129286840 [Prosopis cineraria]
MTTSDANSTTSSESYQQLQRATSAHFRSPSLHLLSDTEESREKYLNLGVPLYKAALKGDWKAVKHIIEQDSALLTAAITKGWLTVLHVAAGANHVHLVEELVKLMNESDLELQDYKGNTAFCFAAASGNTKIAEIMWQRNTLLPTIRGGQGVTPVVMAALQGKSAMAWYLYPKTFEMFGELDWILLFFISINTGIYDLALELLRRRPTLALAQDGNNGTALHVLARKPSNSGHQSSSYQKQIMKSCVKQNLVIELVRNIWKQILLLDELSMMKVIREPSQVIFDAAEVGNFEFLEELLSSYPDLMMEKDSRNRSIIHLAVLHRHASIFNLIHETGPNKDSIVSSLDSNDKCNLLHFAAKLAPPDRLDLVSGAAFQMMLELLWFEEVKKIMQPSAIEMKNSEGLTPSELFTEEHAKLLKEAESWMKGTAKSCMVVSTLIATGVFSAAFTIPGANNNETGTPNYLEKLPFLIFSISDVSALISSSTSILIFLSILISRYAEKDFLKSLPLKLVSGLIALFISVMSMMIAFSSAFFVTYYHGVKWVPCFISVLAFVPIPLFLFLQFPLGFDILYTKYFCRSLFRPNKHILY